MTRQTGLNTEAPSSRIQRRQERTRKRILEVATERFAGKNVAAVSVEEIIEAADVSRGTFYKLFKHKDEVLSQIVQPMLDLYGAKLAAIDSKVPSEVFDQIIDVYIQIWIDDHEAFSLASREAPRIFHLLEESHRLPMQHMRRLFNLIEPHGILRVGKADQAVALLARSAVIVLRTLTDDPDWQRLFRESMQGLLLKDMPTKSAQRRTNTGRT